MPLVQVAGIVDWSVVSVRTGVLLRGREGVLSWAGEGGWRACRGVDLAGGSGEVVESSLVVAGDEVGLVRLDPELELLSEDESLVELGLRLLDTLWFFLLR